MGQQQEVRPGDWRCPECSAHNYASKEACYRCQIPKCAPCLPFFLSYAKQKSMRFSVKKSLTKC